MTCNWGIALGAIVIPFFLIGPILGFIRLRDIKFPKDQCWERWKCYSFSWLVFAVGITERTIALFLFIFAPSALLPFIGGWMTAKYVVEWNKVYGPRAREETLLALIGTSWSFAFAVVAAYWIHPQSLANFAGYEPYGPG